MKARQILILFLLGLTLTSFGQKAHYFKPWKSKVKFEKRRLFFLSTQPVPLMIQKYC